MNIKLTKSQWERISEILGNGGLLVIGSIVIPFLLGKQDIYGILIGLVVAVFLWYGSIRAARKY